LKYADMPPDRIEVISDWAMALQRAVAATPGGHTLFVLPTYTAMLELRAVLTREGALRPYWKRPPGEAKPDGADGAREQQRGDVPHVAQHRDGGEH
jgi:hypothetical protein